MKKKKSTICYVAGKSGGHIIPCLTHAKTEKEKGDVQQVLFFTTKSELDKKIVGKSTVVDHHISLPFASVPGKKLWRYPYFLYAMMVSIIKSIYVFARYRPVSVVSMGGLISVPVCLAAWVMRINVVLYELNVEPGKAISLLAPLAREVCICFLETQPYFPKIVCTKVAYPVRYGPHTTEIAKSDARARMQLVRERFTILLLGGSQGSLFLNNLVKRLCEYDANLAVRLQVIHQTGGNDAFDWAHWYEQQNIPAFVFSFKDDVSDCYVAADIVFCRAGAGTLAETVFFNKRCITIPLQTAATAHQVLNARAYEKEYGKLVKVILQEELETEITSLHKMLITRIR